MFCREEGTVLLIFTVGITFCTFRPCRGADTNDLSDAPGKGAVGVEGWLADTSSRLGTFWKWRQLEKTRESAGAADLARDWLETSSRARPHTDTSSRYNAAPTPEYLSEGLRRDRDKRGTAGGPQPHIPREWEDMRPVVECGSNVMTVTARGRGNTHLLIARENGPPISFFELPSNCGYSVKITWQDLVLKAPYDGCHVLKENDNYILPLLWWGTPVKVACPVKSALPRSHVSVSCLPLGMSLKIKGQQVEANKLWIKLNGKWVPSMSAQCVYRIEASPGEVVLYLPYSLCDLPLKDGVHTVSVLWNGSEQIISCTATTNTQFPQYFAFNYQPPHPSTPAPTAHSTQSLEFSYFYPMRPIPDPVAKHPGLTPRQTSSLPAPLPLGAYPVDIPHLPSKHHYFPMMHMFYPHLLMSILASPHYHHMLPMFYPYFHPPAVPPSASAASPPVPTTAKPLAVLGYIPPTPTTEPSTTLGYRPYIPKVCRPTSPHGLHGDYVQYPQQVPASYPDCTGHSFPSQSLSTPIPNRPQTEVMPSLTCLTNIMTVKLPSAHPDSLRVMGPNNNWVPISTVPPSCAYKLISGTRGVILSTPLPACHTRNLPSVRSFLLMFWDAILGRYRTLELRCPTPSPLNVPSVPTHPPIQTPIEPSPLKPPPFLSPTVFCSANNMRVELPPGPIWSISIKDVSGGAVRVKDAPKQCGYNVNKGKGGINILVLPFNSCHMTLQGNEYRIHLRFQTQDGQEEESVLSCPVHSLITKQECSFPIEKRIPCGPESCSRKECDSLGCCFSSSSGTCFYPMDECTVDHFVFSVPASIMDPPLNPASLFVASNNSCTPQKVTPNFALFKIPLVGCGAHRYEIGQTVVYMLEILNIVRSITLGYGTITRDSPLRLLVECRFVPGSRVTVGYLVKTPSLGPSIQAHGTFGVQLRIATDEHYTSFYPQYHRPLRLLLGKPLHLEVRLLNPPDPNLVLLVHYCLAYPRSAQATWVLIYDGCPNRLDLAPKQPLPPPAPVPSQTKRFTITTFQFLAPDGHTQLDEEIYFMCSTEVCSPSEGPCVEGCFTGGEQSLASIKS
ncbi:uncharacterized protein LOC108939825 isoform X1 [Scleropages formosus]|uniref:uncharacterized protein LOC108939825 isoform X1 n=1 Tax=Scleropages formosus TaxID=113540 RepID=UPI0010FABE77|nr:uncharacterized protein LOC108939825 isoform X1 [Scleropages formosus]